MAFDYSKLSGKIREVFGTQRKFATAIEVGYVALSQKLNNKSEFSQREISKSCDALGILQSEIPTYFFTPKVQKDELAS